MDNDLYSPLSFRHGMSYCVTRTHNICLTLAGVSGIGINIYKVQPRQHEADQHDGVFKLIETRLADQPRPQPRVYVFFG
jgi:hypothetical protein